MTPAWRIVAIVGVVAIAGLGYWTYTTAIEGGSSSHQAKARTLPTPDRPPSNDPVLVGAGDISSCNQDNDAATAKLVNQVIGSALGQVGVFTVGDNAYETGTDDEFHHCYGPTWGQFNDRTRPAPGNHEYKSGNADGYFNYFGANAAGDPSQGYYSYDVGSWHIIVLNTSDHCRQVACDEGSPQEQWLRSDLAAHPAQCTLAMWHDPLFTSGTTHGNAPWAKPFWDDLYKAGADLVISAHEHNYERFALQTPDGAPDAQFGIREFVVGTGGESHYADYNSIRPNSEVRNAETFGVIRLVLHPDGYDWDFLPAYRGDTFQDSGSGACHGAPKS